MAWNGNLGKFSERMKKIRFDKSKQKKTTSSEIDNHTYSNFLKVIAAIPLMVYDNTHDSINDKVYDDVNISGNKKDKSLVKNKINDINNIDVSQIKKKQIAFYNNSDNKEKNKNKETKFEKNSSNVKDPKELEKRIINLIKKNLITMVNEYEILQSDLYVLSQVNGDDKVLNQCLRNVDEIKKILCKIDKLKKKYDFLKDNFDFEYMLETDDLQLVDDIITLKEQFSQNEVKALVEDYKLLDVYKYLYLRIDQLKDDTVKFEEYKNLQVLELEKRDIDFEKLKKDVYNISRVNESYNYFVEQQVKYLDELNKKVADISSYEDVSYRLRGFNKFLLNSFKYVGLLMLNPLKGVVPSIATETVLTRNVVSNLYKNMGYVENRRMIYDAIDYSSEIKMAIANIESTSNLVDMTLDDLVKLKIKYNEQFKKYQGDFSEYEEVIRKINDMENKILGNKIKIEIMKKRMYEKEQINAKKLIKVKELNSKAS